MFPSSLTLAPVIGVPVEGCVRRTVIVAWPTRGGCGSTSGTILTSGSGLIIGQPARAATKRHKRHKPIILFVPLRICGINALSRYHGYRFSMQSAGTRRDFFALGR